MSLHKSTHPRLTAALALAVLVLLCAVSAPRRAWAAGGGDDLTLLDGSSLKDVTVLQDRFDKVVVDTDGDGEADRRIDAGEVVEISYGDDPLAMRQGRFHLNAGNFDTAIEKFQEAIEEKDAREFWLLPRARYLLGETYRRRAEADGDDLDMDRALAAYAKVVEHHPNSRTVPYAIEGIGRWELAQGDAAAALEQFDQLLEDDKYGAYWTLRGKLGKARALNAQGKGEEGLKLAEQVMEATKDPSLHELHSAAEDARTELLFAAGRYEAVRKEYRDLLKTTPEHDSTTRARAYNRIGDAYFAENKVKEAVFAYLRVRVLYPQDREQLAHALYGAARCFTSMKKPREVSELMYLLEDEHPDSDWTAKAKAELGD